MLRILIFRKSLYHVSETFIRTQVEYVKDFFSVYLVADKFTDDCCYERNDIHKVKLNSYEKRIGRLLARLWKSEVEPRFQFYNSWQMARLIKKKKINLIHAHFGVDALRILPVAQKNRIPLVVSFHGYDASKMMYNEWYRSKLPELFDYASKIIVVSRHMVNTLHLGSWANKVLLLPCSIDTDKFKPFAKKKSSKLILLHSGRLVNKKGVPDLIQVFAKLYNDNKNLHLNIVGDGPEKERCLREALELGVIEAVSFFGRQPHAVVKRMMNEADIFILNSRVADDGDMEGTPVSVLEAMSMAKAVVATDHAGIGDVIQDNINGRLVPEKNSQLLEQALRELINDEQQRAELGKQARHTMISEYSHHVRLPVLRDTLLEVAKEFV
jgi:glycosyltransferase involved in cell wall biosynthesis